MSYLGPYIGYQNDPNNIRIHIFWFLGDLGCIWTHIGSKCLPDWKKWRFSNSIRLVAYLDVGHDAYLRYQNVSNNTRNHNFGVLGDFGYNWTDIGSKSVPQRGKNDNFPTLLCL